MGREAKCRCRWGSEESECKALLETNELIVRGSVHQRILIASIKNVSVEGGWLRFRAGKDDVMFELAEAAAQKWARALVTPPPSLAYKLSISSKSRILVIGRYDSDELKAAVAEAASSDAKDPELILACVQTELDLDHFLGRYAGYKDAPPVWIIYAKGPKSPLGESRIRAILRGQGFMDTKVASVSDALTALRFIKRSQQAT